MPGGGELFGERNRGVAPPDHRPVGGRVARAEVEAVCGNEPRRNVASEPEASVKFPEPLLAGRRDEERRIVAALRDEPHRFAHQLRSQSASPERRVRRYAINIGCAAQLRPERQEVYNIQAATPTPPGSPAYFSLRQASARNGALRRANCLSVASFCPLAK